jgi:hypothetical protein
MSSQGYNGRVSGSVRQFGIAAIFVVCLAAPVLEMFDRWDQTLQTGNDTEANLVIAALCVGVAFVAARAFLNTAPRAWCFAVPSVGLSDRFVHRALTPPTPTIRPPTPLRV